MTVEVDPATILSIRNGIRACTRCDLRKTAKSPVPWSGDLHPDLLVLGEAPGQQENLEGTPFIGPAGILLKQKLMESGIHHVAKIAYANATQCFPNRGLSPTQDIHYIDTCRQWMRSQVALLQPQFVLTVGQVAFRSVWGDLTWPTLLQLHGKPLYWDDAPAPAKPTCVWSTYHPSAALRSGKYKRILLQDLRALKSWVDTGEVWPDDLCYCCGTPMTGWDSDGRGIPLCDRHLMRQGELALT